MVINSSYINFYLSVFCTCKQCPEACALSFYFLAVKLDFSPNFFGMFPFDKSEIYSTNLQLRKPNHSLLINYRTNLICTYT